MRAITGAMAGLLAVSAAIASAAQPVRRGPRVSPGVTLVRVGHFPAAVALYAQGHTVYSVNNGDNDLSVLDGASCNALTPARCRPSTVRQDVGMVPSAMAIDARLHTGYVANFTQATRGTSVSVVDLSRCNATHTRGCRHFPHLPPVIPLPFEPANVALNPSTNTLYIDGGSGDLAIVDERACHAGATRGCRHPFITTVAAGAMGITVNPKTNTVYTDDYFHNRMSVIDGRACNAQVHTGCNHPRATVRVGRHPWVIAVDQRTNTVYVPNFGGGTVWVYDGSRCNRRVRSGCGAAAGVLRSGQGPEGVAIDDANHVGFVTNSLGDTVSIFDASHCEAKDVSGCSAPAAKLRVGSLPDGIAIDQARATVYVADNASNTLAVFEAVLP